MILCFGTTPAISRTMQFPQFEIGEMNRAVDVYTYVAGKAINATRAVLTLGGEAIGMGVQGGLLGPSLLALMDRDKIPHRFVKTVAPTRLVITVIDEARTTATELIEDSPPMTREEGETLLTQLGDQLASARIAVFSGSLARGLDADFYARCIRLAHERGVRVVLDTSGEPLRQAIQEKPEVIKINAAELASLSEGRRFRDDAELIEHGQAIVRQSGGRLIVTRGHESTLAIDRNGTVFRVEPLTPERVISPIGSGDSFAAGVAVALWREEPLGEMLTLATACAVANVQTPHAAHFQRDEAERLRSLISVSQAG